MNKGIFLFGKEQRLSAERDLYLPLTTQLAEI